MNKGLDQYFEEVLLKPNLKTNPKLTRPHNIKITLSQYFEKELLEETSAEERMLEIGQQLNSNTESYYNEEQEQSIGDNQDEEIDIYTSYASYMSSSDPGSDNLLVTFDYGFEDSLEADLSSNSQEDEIYKTAGNKDLFEIPEEEPSMDLLTPYYGIERTATKSPNIFKVHQVQHLKNNSNTSSRISLATSLVEYNIDTSGDYGSWAQATSEQGEDLEQKENAKIYRYEDLIKDEVLIHDDDDEEHFNNNKNYVLNDNDGKEVLINFNFDEDVAPRWFNHNLNNEQLYYRSADYLN